MRLATCERTGIGDAEIDKILLCDLSLSNFAGQTLLGARDAGLCTDDG